MASKTISNEKAAAYKKYLTPDDLKECAKECNYGDEYVRSIMRQRRFNEDVVNDLNTRLRKAVLLEEKAIKKAKKLSA